MSDWAAVRKKAADRRRRVIFNNDGDDVFFALEPTPAAFLANRCIGLEGSQVDTIVYCTCAGGFDRYSHDSRVAQLFTATIEPVLPRNHARALIDQGRDNLTLVIEFCRANGLEVFWSIRMNDLHDCWYPCMLSDFKKDHPDLLLWRPGDRGRPGNGTIEPHMFATAMDYGRSEVRDRQFDTIRDVCERYDIDGVELDFMRNPIYFRPNMEGRAVEAGHLDTMTAFVRRTRTMADDIGRARGKPILISSRVPNMLAACKYIGLDVERWLEQDMLDMIIPSIEFTPFTGDIIEMVALGHSRQVPVYPCIGGPHQPGAYGIGVAGWAGAATNAWANGADGIATFNEFDPKHPAWRIVGELETLGGADKVYAVDDLSLRVTRMHEHVIDRAGRLPILLEWGQNTDVRLPACEDITRRRGRVALLLLAKIEKCSMGDRVTFTFNGTPLRTEVLFGTEGLAPGSVGTVAFTSRVDPGTLRCGDNTVGIQFADQCRENGKPVLTELSLHLRRQPETILR